VKKNIKQFTELKKWLKYVPNSLTLCNSLCGFASIIVALSYNNEQVLKEIPESSIFILCSWLILGAMIFDCLDGFSARLLNAASLHGVQMDSLADMVTFGVAPATLLTAMTYSLKTLDLRHSVVVWILAAFYLGGAALRLATYNVHAIQEKKSDDKFHGLPSPGAAAAICTTVLFYNELGADHTELWWVLPVYGAILGLLMVSPVRYLHIGKWLTSIHKSKRKSLIVLILLLLAIFYPAITGFVFINGYILLGLLFSFWNFIRNKKEA
jgi:CDP-diacylglycerol--serine O-phosphatidyltransferase